ncbi:MAG: hypothetical protein GC150_14285 [Rhizobiales bacterium]|nr:hypothetical protein [Hyphomicrobiales bacterium]
MPEALPSTWIVDLILMLMLAELVALTVARQLWGRGPKFADVAPNLAAGAALAAALRAELAGEHWSWMVACLTASLGFHLIDITLRMRTTAREP